MSAADEQVRQDIALMAGQAESADGPASGGAVRAGRPELSTASLKFKGRCAIGSADGLAAALEFEPRMQCAPCGAVAGQAPPPVGRADRPAPNLLEATVNAIDAQDEAVELIDPTELVCPGCFEPAVGERPLGWPASAGACPEFSHPDGSVLCPDAGGAIGEPVEASRIRFQLTEQGTRALDRSTGRDS